MDKRIDQLLIKASEKMSLGKKLAIDDDVTLGLKGRRSERKSEAIRMT
jgi:hypothetical protein